MSGYYIFEAQIQPIEWGRATYTVLILPDEIADALSEEGARRVEGELNDHPINLGISKADAVPGAFLGTGKSLLDAANVTPGDMLEVRLRKADENTVGVPSDVVTALFQAQKHDVWDALTPGKQRGYLHSITSAKRPQTRAKRITKLMEMLS